MTWPRVSKDRLTFPVSRARRSTVPQFQKMANLKKNSRARPNEASVAILLVNLPTFAGKQSIRQPRLPMEALAHKSF